MLAGGKSLADVEELSTRMSTPIERLFGIQRRVPLKLGPRRPAAGSTDQG